MTTKLIHTHEQPKMTIQDVKDFVFAIFFLFFIILVGGIVLSVIFVSLLDWIVYGNTLIGAFEKIITTLIIEPFQRIW